MKIKKSVFVCIIAVLLVFSCQTTVKIGEDLSPAELIQKAQEASDRSQYNTALQYYYALYERNQSILDLVITAEYEIAFIYYKQKKYDQAKDGFNSLLKYYDTRDQEILPKHYKVLSEIVLDKIDKIENDPKKTAKSEKTP